MEMAYEDESDNPMVWSGGGGGEDLYKTVIEYGSTRHVINRDGLNICTFAALALLLSKNLPHCAYVVNL